MRTEDFGGNAEHFEYVKKATLFSVVSLAKEVPLQLGKLAPVERSAENCAVAEFTYHSGLPIPPDDRQAGVLVAVGDREIEEQFVALLTVCSARLWDLREERVRPFIGTRDGSEPHLRQLVKGTNWIATSRQYSSSVSCRFREIAINESRMLLLFYTKPFAHR